MRSAVANFDDPDMPASTVRAWVLGVLWAILLPGMNQFFYFRYPTVAIGGVRPSRFFVPLLPPLLPTPHPLPHPSASHPLKPIPQPPHNTHH